MTKSIMYRITFRKEGKDLWHLHSNFKMLEHCMENNPDWIKVELVYD